MANKINDLQVSNRLMYNDENRVWEREKNSSYASFEYNLLIFNVVQHFVFSAIFQLYSPKPLKYPSGIQLFFCTQNNLTMSHFNNNAVSGVQGIPCAVALVQSMPCTPETRNL